MSKRVREGTPCKGGRFKELQGKMGQDLEDKLALLTGALGNVKCGSLKDLKENMVNVIKKFVIPTVESVGTANSDLITEIMAMESKIEAMEEEQAMLKDRIKDLENCREKNDVKISRKEMSEKVAVSAKQFKVMDMDFEKEIGERKDLIAKAKEVLKDKIRSDKKARYDELIRKATVQVLARTTTKRKPQDSDNDIWTAPILVSVDEREARWELEDMFRQSKVYPTFHWNREMVGLVKDMRNSLKDKFDDKHYIRIRPEERDGKWRIKADVKSKEGTDRFRLGASWEIPPMCPDVRKKNPGWVTPTWAQVAAGQPDTTVTDMED
jgi:hypothetical protein